MQNKDEYYMREALKEAKIASQKGAWPIGCVIVADDEIIARAHNQGKDKKDKLNHAEMLALQEVLNLPDINIKFLSLYTTFEPCLMCLGALVLSQVDRVITGVNLDKSGILDIKPKLSDFYQKPKFSFSVTKGILSEECKEIFSGV